MRHSYQHNSSRPKYYCTLYISIDVSTLQSVLLQGLLKNLLTCVLQNSIPLLSTINKSMNQCKLCSECLIFSLLLNLFITGRYIFFCEYHVSWKCGPIKLCTCLNCGSIQVFCNNRSSISSLIHRNLMIFHLINSY